MHEIPKFYKGLKERFRYRKCSLSSNAFPSFSIPFSSILLLLIERTMSEMQELRKLAMIDAP